MTLVKVSSIEELDDILSSNSRVVVDFSAPGWCVPCRQFAPHFERAAKMVDNTTFAEVDIDKVPEAADRYQIRSVPTVALFENSERVRDIKSRTVVKFVDELE